MPGEVSASAANPTHGFATKFFYGLGSIAFGVKDNGFQVLLLLFYNQALGLDAWLAGLAVAVALFLDAFLDPLIGYWSDHLDTRWGRRHPFMYAAAVPVALSYLLLFSPPSGLGQWGLFTYLLVSAIFVRTFISVYEVPSSALVAELTQSYDQRTSYLGWRYFFGWMGGLTMSVMAFAVFFTQGDGKVAGSLIPANYRGYGIVAAVIMFAAIMISSLGTHRAIPWLNRPEVREGHDKRINPLRDILRALSSRDALTILLADTIYALASGLVYGMAPFFFTHFWALTSTETAILLTASYVAAGIALTLTPVLAARSDKRRASIYVTIGILLTAPISLVLSLIGIFPANGTPALMRYLWGSNVISIALLIMQGILFTAMLADVVEEHEVRTGQREEGVFFAADVFVRKCVSGLGVITTATLLSVAGFPAHANPGTVPAETLTRLGQYYVAVIIALNLASILCIVLFRITREAHARNLMILEERRHGDLGGAPAAEAVA